MWNDDDEVDAEDDDYCDGYDDEADDEDEQNYKSPVRGMSEDIAASMDMED